MLMLKMLNVCRLKACLAGRAEKNKQDVTCYLSPSKIHNKSKYKSYFIMSYSKHWHACSVTNLTVVVSCHTIYNVSTYAVGFKVVSTAILLNPYSFLIYTM